jgi:hypothetical protein
MSSEHSTGFCFMLVMHDTDLYHDVLCFQSLWKKRKKALEMLCWSLTPIVKLAR